MATEAALRVLNRLAMIRQILLSGDLLALAEQENLLRQELQGAAGALTPDERARLQGQARENETLLNATRGGIRSALRRMAEIRAAATAFGTYDDAGKRQDLPHRASAVDRLF